MSSARGRKGRVPADLYETPAEPVRALLDSGALNFSGMRWVEPSAGSGKIISAVGTWCEERGLPRPTWTAVEARRSAEQDLRRACELACAGVSEIVIADFVELAPPEQPYDVMLGNPPYTIAFDFVRKCVTERWARRVCFLLRAAFLESAGRYEWLSKSMPDVYVLPTRPSFVNGSTDSSMYAWMVWDTLAPQVQGKIQLLKPRVRARGFEEVHRS